MVIDPTEATLTEATLTGPAVRVEHLRGRLLGVRACIRALETRAGAGPLPEPATRKLIGLRRTEGQLWQALRLVTREDIPGDPE